jgi:hypothetical protein
MTTSGTFQFNPSLGEITLYAFNACGIRSTEILQQHMESARMAANLLLGRWSSQGVNLWSVDLQSIPLVQGQATYTTIDPSTVVMLDTYVVNASSDVTDRLILPISRSEYAAIANPNRQGFPTSYWFERTLSPTVTLWPVPDGNQVSLNFYRVRQAMDANFTNGQTVEIPYYFTEAFALGLAYRLAVIWAPDKAAQLKALADESYTLAADRNVESSNMYIVPSIAGYFRN